MNQLISMLAIALFLPLTVSAETLALSDAQIEKMQISTTKVSSSSGEFSRSYSAEVVVPSNQTQIISVPQHGLVTALKVATGQDVKKGQVIAQMRSAEFVDLQGAYLQAKTQLALATKTANRDQALAEEGIIPQRRYIESKSAREAMDTALMQAKQALRLAGMSNASISRLKSANKMQSLINIVAPMAGQVMAQHAKVGDRLDSGLPLYQIARLTPLWVEMNVPIEEAASINNSALVTIPKLNASGNIITVLRRVNKATQTLQVRAEINQGAQALAIGQFVEATLAINMENDSIQVPKSALVRNGQQNFIFKRIEKGFAIIQVNILNEDAQNALVQGELTAGDRIASKGLAALKGSWLGLGGE